MIADTAEGNAMLSGQAYRDAIEKVSDALRGVYMPLTGKAWSRFSLFEFRGAEIRRPNRVSGEVRLD